MATKKDKVEEIKEEVQKTTFYFPDPACSIEAETQEEAVQIFKKKYFNQ